MDSKKNNIFMVSLFAFMSFFTFIYMAMSGEEPNIYPLKDLSRVEDIADLNRMLNDIRNKMPIAVKIGSFTCPSATGNYSVTGIGFEPRYVEFNTATDIDAHVYSQNGCMDYSGNQWSKCGASIDDIQYCRVDTDKCINTVNSSGDAYITATYSSMDKDGFTINFTAVNNAYTILYKAVR